MKRVRHGYEWPLWLACGLFVISGCGSGGGSGRTATGPSSDCTLSLTRTTVSVPASSGTARVTVSTRSRCEWTAVSSASWLTVSADAHGPGSGGLGFSFESNPTLESRTATITVSDQVLTITQEAPSLAGTWVATGTDALRAAAFTVRDGAVTRVRLTYLFPLGGGRTCDRTYTQDVSVPSTDGRFRVAFQTSGVSTTIVAAFESAFVATGVVERQTFANATCGAGPSFSGIINGLDAVFRLTEGS